MTSKRTYFLAGLFGAIGVVSMVGYGLLGAGETSATAAGAIDVVAGEALYQEYCASCHGAELQGEKNWRTPNEDGTLPAPPHDATGHTWHHGDTLLFNYTKKGGKKAMADMGLSDFASGMPGFENQLSDAEIWNVLAFIKSTWPERQRELQAMRTQSELEQEKP